MLSIDQFQKTLNSLRTDFIDRRKALHKDIWHTEASVEKDFAEQVTQRENDDVIEALDGEAKYTLEKIESALLRIKEGSYGICLECGIEITEPRLLAVPYAEYCITCADNKGQ